MRLFELLGKEIKVEQGCDDIWQVNEFLDDKKLELLGM